MEFITLAKERYSCRKLTDAPVEQEKIDRILDAARLAPTAVNYQPYKIWVIQSPEAVEKIKSTTKYSYGANCFILVGGKKEDAWVRTSDSKNFAEVDASIVATHMVLAIHDQGLCSTWVAGFDVPKLKELFPQTADYDLVALFPIGYPAEGAHPAHLHNERKPMEELVEVL